MIISSITLLLLTACSPESSKAPGTVDVGHQLPIVNGVHQESGFVDDPNLPLIVASCTACHSGKLVTQNRATREGWKNMIVWMQETQKLWDLGENEAVILDYLEKNYSPELTESRRANLADIEWYDFSD